MATSRRRRLKTSAIAPTAEGAEEQRTELGEADEPDVEGGVRHPVDLERNGDDGDLAAERADEIARPQPSVLRVRPQRARVDEQPPAHDRQASEGHFTPAAVSRPDGAPGAGQVAGVPRSTARARSACAAMRVSLLITSSDTTVAVDHEGPAPRGEHADGRRTP